MEVRPGYKQTEVGVIPEDWGVESLDKIADSKRPICYGIVQVGQFSNDGITVLAIKNLNGDYVTNIHRCSYQIERAYARSRVLPGDVLVSVKGTVGRIGLVPPHFSGNISRDLARIALSDSDEPAFWYQLLQSEMAQRRLEATTVGTTRMELSIGPLKQVKMPRPPKEEQRAIAKALGDSDALLRALDGLITKKRDLKQAAMQQLLTGLTRLSGFQEEWEDMQVQNAIARFFCGPSPTCEERNIQDDHEWGVLKTTAVTKENGWDWTKHKTLPRMFWNKPNLELKKGDVIVTKAGPRHRVGVSAWVDYVPPRIIVSGKMIGLRPRADRVVPVMLASAISSPATQAYLDQRTTGMAESQVNFENSALLEAPIKLPRLDEQRAIAAVLTDMEAELTVLEERFAKTRALKQGMMHELLTGKTRLCSPEVTHA